MKPTTIHYLNDAAGSISYVDRDGETITKTPHDDEYNRIVERLSIINTTLYLNQQARNNYEQSVKNAQVSIDAGIAENLIPPVLPVPKCVFYADDWSISEAVVAWEPPLLKPKPGPVSTNRPNAGPLPNGVSGTQGTQSASSQDPAAVAMANVLTILGAVGPSLPNIIELLLALLSHHDATRADATTK